MQEEIRKQTWKFFWEQKWEEVSKAFIILFIIWSIFGAISQIGWADECWMDCDGNGDYCRNICSDIEYETMWPMWMMVSGIITTGIWIIIGIGVWIKDNWKKAEKRAKIKYRVKKTAKNSKANKK